jgi:hypothetical protein
MFHLPKGGTADNFPALSRILHVRPYLTLDTWPYSSIDMINNEHPHGPDEQLLFEHLLNTSAMHIST